jgi:hypothetical protein
MVSTESSGFITVTRSRGPDPDRRTASGVADAVGRRARSVIVVGMKPGGSYAGGFRSFVEL